MLENEFVIAFISMDFFMLLFFAVDDFVFFIDRHAMYQKNKKWEDAMKHSVQHDINVFQRTTNEYVRRH